MNQGQIGVTMVTTVAILLSISILPSALATARIHVITVDSQKTAGFFNEHYNVFGTIKNVGDTRSGPITLQLTVLDHGEVILQKMFEPDVRVLEPGASTTYSVPFTVSGFVSWNLEVVPVSGFG
jgi:hypothetical protein